MKLQIIRSTLSIIVISLVCPGCGVFGESSPDTSNMPWELVPGKLAFGFAHEGGLENNFSGLSLYVLDGEAEELRQVRHWNGIAHLDGVAWSPDGQQLAFSYDENQSNETIESRLFVIDDIDGSSGSERLAFPDASGVISELHPSWSADDKLAYLFRGDHPGGFAGDEVFVNGAQFFDCVVPGAISGRCAFTTLAWSPTGEFFILGIRDETSQSALYRVDVADKSVTPLLQGPNIGNSEFFHAPQVSPDGTQVVFTRISLTKEGAEIWVINADGSNQRQLTSSNLDSQPNWSPDGSSIAFVRIPLSISGPREENQGVMIVDQDGGAPTQLIPDLVTHLLWAR